MSAVTQWFCWVHGVSQESLQIGTVIQLCRAVRSCFCCAVGRPAVLGAPPDASALHPISAGAWLRRGRSRGSGPARWAAPRSSCQPGLGRGAGAAARWHLAGGRRGPGRSSEPVQADTESGASSTATAQGSEMRTARAPVRAPVALADAQRQRVLAGAAQHSSGTGCDGLGTRCGWIQVAGREELWCAVLGTGAVGVPAGDGTRGDVVLRGLCPAPASRAPAQGLRLCCSSLGALALAGMDRAAPDRHAVVPKRVARLGLSDQF